MVVTTERAPPNHRFESEETYVDPATGQRRPLGDISDIHSVELSVVVPAYNEEERCMFPTLLHTSDGFTLYFYVACKTYCPLR